MAAKSILWIALAFLITRCVSVGPDYARPATHTPDAWSSELPPGLTTGDLEPQQIARWWRSLNDPALSRLIEAAVAGNKSLQQTAQRVVAARANRGLAYSAFFPNVGAQGSATGAATNRGTDSVATGANYSATDPTTALIQESLTEDEPDLRRTTTYSAGFDASWELDLFGKTRRSVEAADADLAATRAEYRDGLVSLAAEVALAYIELRTFERRLSIATDNLESQESSLELARWRNEAGLSDRLDLEQARLNVASTRSLLPGLRGSIQRARHNLATLIGVTADRIPADIQELMQTPGLPGAPRELAIDLPANALRRRPDVRQAERQLAAETARIGVAEAELYPQLRLPGSLSYELSAPGTDGWTGSLGIGFNWNVFDAGAIHRRIDVRTAAQQEALYFYEARVLAALEEIEAALTAYGSEEERRASLATAADHAATAARLTRLKYQSGLLDFGDVLQAEQRLLSAQDELAQSEGETVANFVRLYKALGGGWSAFDAETEAEK
jgi:NodT family efflux transporter outer membrane factor (OMF) lipoprotein